MSEEMRGAEVPARHDVVEVIDHCTGYRVSAAVDDVSDGRCVLRFDLGAEVPREATLHWDHGEAGWRVKARLERVDETSACFQIPPVAEWEPAPARRSLRTPVDNAPMLVRISQSAVLPKNRRVHAVCVDVSDSGCRASWPGPAPLVGDAVELAWDYGKWQDEQPLWVPARVARVISLPFSGTQVGLRFQFSDCEQISRVHAWSHAWYQENRRRARFT